MFVLVLTVQLLVALSAVSGIASSPTQRRTNSLPPKCRFSPTYTQTEILHDPSPFMSDLLYWEGYFHANNISYNSNNGMSYDGTLLDETTGLATSKHPFSAASKEALQIMLYAHALAGSKKAARFLSRGEPGKAKEVAYEIMKLKLKTYLKFNETYPGFGGFLPCTSSGALALMAGSFIEEFNASSIRLETSESREINLYAVTPRRHDVPPLRYCTDFTSYSTSSASSQRLYKLLGVTYEYYNYEYYNYEYRYNFTYGTFIVDSTPIVTTSAYYY
ncbi:uncharacterized protein PAC_10456 [Phialocephala subalpina]|uniref:Endo-beta-1,2-glucanase SGL domain-containing protein n=1 Tax=Phialocephala subalpina TaxID=576137 RepID=A0A1L7X6B1_9HELO|nr:uncharacterized protein PAC_10456 [Phialocephala subalpina]